MGSSPPLRKITDELKTKIRIHTSKNIIDHNSITAGKGFFHLLYGRRFENIKYSEQDKCRNEITGSFWNKKHGYQVTVKFINYYMAAVFTEKLFRYAGCGNTNKKQRYKNKNEHHVIRPEDKDEQKADCSAECTRRMRQKPYKTKSRYFMLNSFIHDKYSRGGQPPALTIPE